MASLLRAGQELGAAGVLAGGRLLTAVVASAGSLRQPLSTLAASKTISSSSGDKGSQMLQARWASASTPATLPEVPRRSGTDSRGNGTGPALCLNSINDPAEWGLAGSSQGSSEPSYYWLGSSLSNPKEHCSSLGLSAVSHSRLPSEGITFRSSMADPGPTLPCSVESSQATPAVCHPAPLSAPLAAEPLSTFRSSMTDPPLHRPGRAAKDKVAAVAGARLQR
ncbi:hypothetical protein ABPG77_011055 [Micractinium sp. CCAP 211/92]